MVAGGNCGLATNPVQNSNFDFKNPLIAVSVILTVGKKALGNRGNYFNEFKKWLPEEIADTVSPNNS